MEKSLSGEASSFSATQTPTFPCHDHDSVSLVHILGQVKCFYDFYVHKTLHPDNSL